MPSTKIKNDYQITDQNEYDIESSSSCIKQEEDEEDENEEEETEDILEKELTIYEKKYLLAIERGDIATVLLHLNEYNNNFEKFNKNVLDPFGRSALHIAIEYNNIEMIQVLLNHQVNTNECLLHAINEEFVEAVEMLLQHQDSLMNNSELLLTKTRNDFNKSNNIKKKWKFLFNTFILKRNNNKKDLKNQLELKSFPPDITPLMLAAHKDNYEIIKILLNRGETIMEPHDVKCICHDCDTSRLEDSLKYSKSRINAYKALSSPSLISLSSKDPILTAFKLSWNLKCLSRIENEFKSDYEKLSMQCQEYASALLAETTSSHELEVLLNYNPDKSHYSKSHEKTRLERLKLAIKYKQKKFVTHPHCQQLLVSLWFGDFSGYRQHNIVVKTLITLSISLLFPILSILYLIMPNLKPGRILHQPYVKFVTRSASYVLFLILLILSSLRIKLTMTNNQMESSSKERRGSPPTNIEWFIIIYVVSFIWSDLRQLCKKGVIEFLSNNWNLLNIVINSLYIITIIFRIISYNIVQCELKSANPNVTLYDREKWDAWDPTLISEGIFAIANIFSSLKVVYIFTINSHLGPLQISLGRMIFDIIKFGVFIILVLFSFSCGLNQLYWYYAQMKHNECDIKEFESLEEKEDCYLNVKYFSSLFETIQTLFWGFFGYIDKDRLDKIYRKHTFTMFIGLLMFGTYSTIMVVVLVNMLIAMMNNSYQIIVNQADEEWKFARSKLWLSYFEEGSTLPHPFNLIPTPKSIYYKLKWCILKMFSSNKCSNRKFLDNEHEYYTVMKHLTKRYVIRKQQKNLKASVTEDDLNEIKQDISGLRYELLEILKNNDFKMDHLKYNKRKKKGKLNKMLNLSVNYDKPSRFSPSLVQKVIRENSKNKKDSKIVSEKSVDSTTDMYKIALDINKLKNSISN